LGSVLVGFEAGVENGSDELFGLRFLFSTFPSLFFLAGAAIVWNYPITEARHAEIRAELEGQGELKRSEDLRFWRRPDGAEGIGNQVLKNASRV
jgi:Na+/melibiose symporter-like transporter